MTKSHDKYKEDDAKPKQVVGNHPVYHSYEWPSCLETSEKISILLVNIRMIGQGSLIADGQKRCKWTGPLLVLAKTFIMIKISGQKFQKIFSDG